MSLNDDLAASFNAAGISACAFSVALSEFVAAAQRYDWKACEAIQMRIGPILDGHLDHIAAAYKRMESFENG